MVIMESSGKEQGAEGNTVGSNELHSDMEGASQRKGRGMKRSSVDKNSDEYKKRRERNNLAVKKSRNKSKEKMMQTLERVNKLRAENEMLEAKVQLLTKELSFLKDLFLAHAGSSQAHTFRDLDLSMFDEDNEDSTASNGNQVKTEQMDADEEDSDSDDED